MTDSWAANAAFTRARAPPTSWPGRGLLVAGQIADRGVEVGERRSVGGVRGARGLQGGGITRRFDVGECRRDGGFDRFLGDLGSVWHESQAY